MFVNLIHRGKREGEKVAVVVEVILEPLTVDSRKVKLGRFLRNLW